MEFLVTPVQFGPPFSVLKLTRYDVITGVSHQHPFNFSFPFCQRCMIHLSLWADSEENATSGADFWETFLLFGENVYLCIQLDVSSNTFT